MNILHICANPKPTDESASKQMAAAFFTKLAELNIEYELNNVDLCSEPPPFISYEQYRGHWYPVFIEGYQATDEELEDMAYAREQGELFNQADVLVLTTPMWNYSIPAILKAWIDQIIAPGITFKMEKDGPKPLHSIKQIVLLAASGGVYKEEDPRDCLSAQIREAFAFIGIDNIATAWADGQNPLFFDDASLRKSFAIESAQDLAEEIAEDF